MNTSILKAGCALIVVLAVASWASAIVITPNDDTYLDQTAANTVRDAPTDASGGLTMKGQTSYQRIAIIEFTLPNVTVTSATFNMLHIKSWAEGVTWRLRVYGKVASFDENTITWNNSPGIGDVGVGSGAVQFGTYTTMAGGTAGQGQFVVPAQWRSVDMTDFFNANKGQTIVLVLNNAADSGASNKGGTIEDREGTRTGNPANGPYIDYVPEPAAGLLLVFGLLGLLRRRPA